ncbi:translation initiation factor IF3-4, chloroplastic-like isoform X2 [Actinidia eriantha]|uniref:translation initiation factor IF3-4, chloroplastic-like isoform X2 n=1 Tax=Actinidia eriantha TaxID=165200 RepID=UPI0025889479|nr:translation initiation factor IF3-4, chloroplastic-like isoform X2 [Actinidia eriantha]
MAGLTGTFPFKLLLSRPKPSPPSPLTLSSFNSKLLALRLCNPNFFTPSPQVSAALRPTSARYGGPRGFSRSTETDDDDDEALDLSTVRSATVRLIDAQQNMVGVVPKSEAIQMAEVAELDLVILSPDAEPPVVRIMDYDKYRYELQKKKRGQQKKTAASRMDLKVLKMGYNIDIHDYTVRLKAAKKFLKDGDKVKVIVNLKGRENEFRNNAIELIRRFQNDVGELAIEASKNFRERNIYIILSPNKAVLQKAQEPPEQNEAVNEVSAGV